MMKQSAGILLYQKTNANLRVLLAHPGGPFWKNKDQGCWTIPKGEFTEAENPLDAAIREFEEETGQRLQGDFTPLQSVTLKSGKIVYAWALEQDFDPDKLVSNSFEIEWPPRSGVLKSFPEIDRAEWFSMAEAMEKINVAQHAFLIQLGSLCS